jgi:hypothetical protein
MMLMALIVELLLSGTLQDPARGSESARARTALASARPLTAEEIAIVQTAARQALARRFVESRLEPLPGVPPLPNANIVELQLDEAADIRFKRLMVRDTATPDRSNESIFETVVAPAVRCTDRTPYGNGGRLGLQYENTSRGWHVFPGRIVQVVESGLPDAPAALLFHPAASLTSGTIGMIDGRRARSIELHRPGSVLTAWFDGESLLILQTEWTVTINGSPLKQTSRLRYPSGRSIERPARLRLPDCV